MLSKKKLNILQKLTIKKIFENKEITKMLSTINLPSKYSNENFLEYSNSILKIPKNKKKIRNFEVNFLDFLRVLNIFYLKGYPLKLSISKIYNNKIELKFISYFQKFFNIRIFLINSNLSKNLLYNKPNKFYIFSYNFDIKSKKIVIIVTLNKFKKISENLATTKINEIKIIPKKIKNSSVRKTFFKSNYNYTSNKFSKNNKRK